MSWIPDRYRELRGLLGQDSVAEGVDDEFELHLALRMTDLKASGMDAAAAREEALRRFGNVARYRAQTYAIDESVRREQRRMEIMDATRREMRHAVRTLLRAPVFTLVAVVTLGLGVGATTSIFTLLDSIVLRPLPYPEPDRLVQLWHPVPKIQEGRRWGSSVASYFHYGANATSFENLGAYMGSTYSVSGAGDAERLEGALVSRSLFDVIGARAAVGRLFTEEEDQPGADAVVVLGYDIWQTRYNADPGIVGRTINVNAAPVTVVGVLSPGVNLPTRTTHIWRPFQLDRSAEPINSHYVGVLGRLRPDVSPGAAQTDVQRLTARLPEVFPGAYGGDFYETSGFHASVVPLRDDVVGETDRVLWLLLGAVSLVLLIACANVANLFLVRAEARRRELTVRAALGAERVHMAVHYLTESLLLTLAAALLGIGLAWGGIRLLVAAGPATLPRLGDVAISPNGVLFALAVGLLMGLVFGIGPVLRRRTDFNELRESGRGATISRERRVVRSGLVVGQVGMALVLLAAGGVMLKSFLNLRGVQSGIDGESVLTFSVLLPAARYQEEPSIFQFQRDFVERLGAVPGVELVSATELLPLGGGRSCVHTGGEGSREQGICVPAVPVLPGYFAALGIGVRGQTPSWSDLERRSDGVVISRALAARMWPGEDPIGKGIMSWQDGPPWFRIVGVADDVLADGLDQPPVQAVYYPTRRPDREGYYGPHGIRTMTFLARTSLAQPAGLTPAVRGVLRDMDPEVPLANVRTMRDVIMSSDRMARTTFTMMLLGIAAAIALFLSAVGLYGVIAYLVGRRRAEIGVRMALGANVSGVARLVILQSLRLTAAGIVVGVAAALLVTRALASLVWGVRPTDPLTLLGVSTLLLIVAIVASAVPASRAARTPPVEALRAE